MCAQKRRSRVRDGDKGVAGRNRVEKLRKIELVARPVQNRVENPPVSIVKTLQQQLDHGVGLRGAGFLVLFS